MNTPGMSLFQGADSIKVNTTLEREEEEEALEDQRRRNEELGKMLQNAFDDLEDDESIVDSSSNYQSDLLDSNVLKQQHHQLHAHNDNNTDHKACETQIYQLKTMLQSKTHEVQNIKQLANDEIKKRDDMQKRLMITEAELSRAIAAKSNTYELLVESKEKCSNLENTIEKLRQEKKSIEVENNTLLGKLETSQTILADLQQKYDMMERDLYRQNDRNAEHRRKQLEERQRAELELIQQQMEQLENKLEKKTNELEHMTTRYNALQSSHEAMLVDKAGKINDLNSALNDAQRRCEELLSKPDYCQENIRLQKLVTNLQEQIKSMEKTINTLRERLEFTTAELDVMDTVLQQHNLEDTPHRLSQTQGKVVGSTPLNTIDRVNNLKDELYRALANVKSKREEIRKLQQSLEDKNAEIRQYKDGENKALVEITTLKEDKSRLEHRIKVLEIECKELANKSLNKSFHNEQIKVLNEELLQLKEEKCKLVQQHNELERERNSLEVERKKLDAQIKNVQVDLEELKQEHESLKINYEQMAKDHSKLRNRTTADNMRLELEKHKFLLKDAQAECNRLKNLYVEISNAKDALSYEVEKLRNSDKAMECQEEREKVANLQRALQLSEVKATELSKILETEKLCHEREVSELREKIEKEKICNSKMAKESSNNCTKCIDYMSEITKFEIKNLKLSNANSINKKEIDELTNELNHTKALVAELTDKLKLSEQQEMLIKELKTKAHKFEEYIKNHSSSSDKSTSTKQNTSNNKSVATSPDLLKSDIKKIESRIREEMAKIFAVEIKRVQAKLQQSEEKCLCMQREYQHVNAELQQRHNEVELLKQAILAEREQTTELMSHKDKAIEELETKQNEMLKSCREQLKLKNHQISELLKEMDVRQTQIEAERKSMKLVMTQWEAQREATDAIESDWKKKFEELKEAHDKAISHWQKSYNSAKRTINNYKRYSDDKEEFYKKELARIKSEYDIKFAKISAAMNEAFKKKSESKSAAAAKTIETHLDNNKENEIRN